jgi:hypothetical protein
MEETLAEMRRQWSPCLLGRIFIVKVVEVFCQIQPSAEEKNYQWRRDPVVTVIILVMLYNFQKSSLHI